MYFFISQELARSVHRQCQYQLLYTPQFVVSLLTAVAVAHTPGSLHWVVPVHVGAWIAQFIGHGVAEKRSPALLDNLVGGNLILISLVVQLQTGSCLCCF